MKKLSFYIHIPFCVLKCKYCAFVSFVGKETFFESYKNALIKEILSYKQKLKNYQIKTIFIGGGTPTMVPAKFIAEILEVVRQNFNVLKNCETTIEANPESFTFEKAQIYKKAKVNRISFGLQTDNNKMLKKLGRPHTKQMFENAIKNAKKAGFKNINADILIGLEGQTKQILQTTLKFLEKQNLSHISAYGLMVEQGTPLFDDVNQGKTILPSEEQSVFLYEFAVKKLRQMGFNRYEISNFAKNGFECKHNQNYWKRGEFLGFGVAAYSFLGGTHFENTSNFESYLKNPLKKQNIEKQTPVTAQNEFVMLALRTENGLNIKQFKKQFGVDFEKMFEKELKKLLQAKLIALEKGFLKITNFQVSNYVIEHFFQ